MPQVDGHWVCRENLTITHNLDGPTVSPWRLPTAPPELVLFYKAGGNLDSDQLDQLRDHDEQDFRALATVLTPDQRRWLRDAIRHAHPTHPWTARDEAQPVGRRQRQVEP